MAELSRDKHNYKNTSRSRWRLWVPAALVPAVVIGALVWMTLSGESVDEKLAAVEAARAIPDSENAAILYEQLLDDPRMDSFDYDPHSLKDGSDELNFLRPWSATDYPELADWVDENQWLIYELLKISQYEKCRFPINIDIHNSLPIDRTSMMRKWAFLLGRAANNDVGEGRIDGAIEKWRCIIRMADHFYQQPTAIDILMGMALDRLTMGQLTVCIVEHNVDENHLKEIEELSLKTRDDWESILEAILFIDELKEQKLKEGFSLIDHVKSQLLARRFKKAGIDIHPDDIYERTRLLYSETLASRRGIHILVALRRYKDMQGFWPGSLESIRPETPAELYIDPLNEGDFVYKLTDDGFKLYSKGENNVDEGGQYASRFEKGPDDWPIWPPRGYRSQSETSENE
jgi:hypothetical protein